MEILRLSNCPFYGNILFFPSLTLAFFFLMIFVIYVLLFNEYKYCPSFVSLCGDWSFVLTH